MLLQLLRRLGIDRRNLRSLPLLPLVDVAWADGELHPQEEALIRKLAQSRELRADDVMLLEDWLRHAPSPAYHREARVALSWLRRHGDPALDPRMLDTLPDDAVAVAQSAGGWWFGYGAISKSEQQVLDRLARALAAPQKTTRGPVPFLPPTEVALHPDFVKKNNCVTLAYCATDDIDEDAALEPVFEASVRIPLRAHGTVVGAATDDDVCIEGDDAIWDSHVMVYGTRTGYVAKALAGPLWINGERATERRLLGGETLRLSDASSFVFKWVRPLLAE